MDYLNVSELSIITGKDRRTVSQRLNAAELVPRKNGAANEYKTPTAVRAILAPDLATGDSDTAQAEQARYKAEKMKIELEKIKGEVVSIKDIDYIFSNVTARVKSKILAIPGRIAPEVTPKERAAVVKAADRVIREALEELAGLEYEPRAEDE